MPNRDYSAGAIAGTLLGAVGPDLSHLAGYYGAAAGVPSPLITAAILVAVFGSFLLVWQVVRMIP